MRINGKIPEVKGKKSASSKNNNQEKATENVISDE
jgi:hypothetical protein